MLKMQNNGCKRRILCLEDFHIGIAYGKNLKNIKKKTRSLLRKVMLKKEICKMHFKKDFNHDKEICGLIF